MSSGFVSGGTTDKPIERDDDWLKAQQEIEAARRQKEEASRHENGKTLYEVLQNNKAAKQEAFEESTKLKNQFRNLDEDEIEFLDSVLESTRKKEDDVKRETTEQLDIFRKQQEEADKTLLASGEELDASRVEGSPEASETTWAVNARKRKRIRDKEGLKGIKLRKSTTNDTPTASSGDISTRPAEKKTSISSVTSPGAEERQEEKPFPRDKSAVSAKPTTSKSESPKQTIAPSLGLAGYSSDEEE